MTKVTSAVLDALDVADNKFSGAGQVRLPARRAKNICIRPCDGGETFNLPPVIECNNMPNDLSEIPTPQIAKCHQHLRHVACHIPKLDQSAEISLFQKTNSAGTCHYLECINPPKNPIRFEMFLTLQLFTKKNHSTVSCWHAGPNFSNSLYGVLLRFHRDRTAVIADIEQMFYSFYV